MFSFTKGRPIAIINGGKYDDKVIRIEDCSEAYKLTKIDELKNDIFFDNKKANSSLRELTKLRKSMEKFEEKNEDEELQQFMKDAKKSFQIDDGELLPLPNEDMIERLMVAGASGSGKSTYVGKYIKQYKLKHKKNPVFLFTRNKEDPALDKYKIERVELNEDILEEPIDLEELSNSLCIFDDVDTIPEKPIRDEVKRIQEDLLECGRKEGISVISTSHHLLNYKQTRQLLLESTSITFFPKGGGQAQIIGFLKHHCGLNAKEIGKILKLPSRWITIYRTFPTYILYEKGCFIL